MKPLCFDEDLVLGETLRRSFHETLSEYYR